ncbi:MAG: hypothetical protein Q7R89_03740 [bacterium]|nr:hypothetical protein [bacterium]
MRKSSLLYTALGFMIVFAVLDYVAQVFSLYWTLWWFDIMMHLLGGFSGGLVVLWFFGPFSIYRSLFLTIGCLLVIGIAWEIFEYTHDLPQPINYGLDTVYDLINDTAGAVLSYFYVRLQTPKFS